MKNHEVEFHSFITNTLKEKYFGNTDEKRILLFQDWNENVHEDAKFYEVIELKDSKWKFRYSKWEIGKDTFRLLNIIENLKWTGKEIIPTFKNKEFILTEKEKDIIQSKINNIQIESTMDFNRINGKLLKLEGKEIEISFYWNKRDKVQDSISKLVNELKNKT